MAERRKKSIVLLLLIASAIIVVIIIVFGKDHRAKSVYCNEHLEDIPPMAIHENSIIRVCGKTRKPLILLDL